MTLSLVWFLPIHIPYLIFSLANVSCTRVNKSESLCTAAGALASYNVHAHSWALDVGLTATSMIGSATIPSIRGFCQVMGIDVLERSSGIIVASDFEKWLIWYRRAIK